MSGYCYEHLSGFLKNDLENLSLLKERAKFSLFFTGSKGLLRNEMNVVKCTPLIPKFGVLPSREDFSTLRTNGSQCIGHGFKPFFLDRLAGFNANSIISGTDSVQCYGDLFEFILVLLEL